MKKGSMLLQDLIHRAPWVNYLGSPEYGAIISNNAGDTALKNQVQTAEF